MEKVRRIVLIQKDLYEQIRAIAQREHRSLSGQIVHTFSKKLWRVTKAQRVLAPPVKQPRLGKAPHL